MNKKNVIIKGNVRLPLIIGKGAVIFQNNGSSTYTSIVEAIKQVADNFIMFETEYYIYSVKQLESPASIKPVYSAA